MPSASEMSDAWSKRRESEDRLAEDIIDECRIQLMLKFRFLDLALWRMGLTPLRIGALYPLSTDTDQVIFDPPRVIARFQESFEESVRDYLHMVMHCIFRHPFDRDHDNREAWELTCDIIVENVVMDMCGSRFASDDDVARRQVLSEIVMLVGRLLPGRVYGLIRDMVQAPEGKPPRGLGRSALNEWHDLFERDDHGAWPVNNEEGDEGQDSESSSESDSSSDSDLNSGSESDSGSDLDQDSNQDSNRDTVSDGGSDPSVTEERSEDDANPDESPDTLDTSQAETSEENETDIGEDNRALDDTAERGRKTWEDVSKQIEMNLETFSKEWGDEAGSLAATLALSNRATGDYTEFLRRFMVVTEEMQLNMDEFDYIYYTYGMDLYGDMPLIEPLEYRETRRIRDFVIAVDTSESVRGDLVKRFVEYTFEILRSSESYSDEVNVHLVQCDAKIQSDTRITNLRDVDGMMEGFQIRGFGGTDFRPVFDYVDMLRKQGELTNMKGLIYFTDGFGRFPEKMPDYDAAFVFIEEEGEKIPSVPPWAMKMLIDEAGIGRLKSGIEA